jgi:hypothetical protein
VAAVAAAAARLSAASAHAVSAEPALAAAIDANEDVSAVQLAALEALLRAHLAAPVK